MWEVSFAFVTTDVSVSVKLINQIALEKQMVGKGLQSCTSDISILEAKVAGQRVVVIDTPGIDDTRTGMKEADILIDIATRLAAMYVSAGLAVDLKKVY